jgi:hypothetical protein
MTDDELSISAAIGRLKTEIDIINAKLRLLADRNADAFFAFQEIEKQAARLRNPQE